MRSILVLYFTGPRYLSNQSSYSRMNCARDNVSALIHDIARSGRPDIALVGPTDRDIPRILTATMSRVPGESGSLAWFEEAGAELSGGRMLDTAKLPDGESMVRAVAVQTARLRV